MNATPARRLSGEKLNLYSMVFLANMGWGVMSPVLANVQAEFRVSVAEVALANSAFGFARLFLDIPIGLLVNRVDQRLLRLSGTLLLALGSGLCALAGTFSVLIAGRIINGVGAAIIQVTNLVWVSQLSTNERRGRDLGVYQAVLQAGASISPIAAGFLAGISSWRSSFWFAAVMSLLGFIPMLLGSNSWIDRIGKAPDAHDAQRSVLPQPADHRSAMSALVVANIVTFVLFFTVGGFQNTVIPLYGAGVLSLTPQAIGLALGVSTVLRFFLSLAGGELSDRYGRRAVLAPGLTLMGIGTLMLTRSGNLAGYWLAILVLSAGRFGNNVPATVLVDHGDPKHWGFLMGLNRTIGDLGIVVGPIAMGLALQQWGWSTATNVSAVLPLACAALVMVGVAEVSRSAPRAVGGKMEGEG